MDVGKTRVLKRGGIQARSKPRRMMRFVSHFQLQDLAILILMILALFNYGFGHGLGLSGGEITMLRLAMLLLPFGYAIAKLNSIQTTNVHVFAYSYALLVILSGIITNEDMGSAIVEGLCIFLMFSLPDLYLQKYDSEMLDYVLFGLLALITVVVDVFILFSKGAGIVTIHNEFSVSSNYLIGGKFTISYLNMLMIGYVYQRHPSAISLLLSGLVGLVICSLVQCSTGITGIVLMVGLILFSYPVKVVWPRKSTVALAIVIAAFVAVLFTELLTWGPFGLFITNVLGESSDLTGRTSIYPVLIDLFLKRPVCGYGSAGAANLAVGLACGAADAQEGLFHILLSNGLLGAGLFLGLCVTCLASVRGLDKGAVGLYSFLVSMAVCSAIEINLGLTFILGLSLFRLQNPNVER